MKIEHKLYRFTFKYVVRSAAHIAILWRNRDRADPTRGRSDGKLHIIHQDCWVLRRVFSDQFSGNQYWLHI